MQQQDLAELLESLSLRLAGSDPVQAISGGSIAQSFRLQTAQGAVFLKLGAATHPFDAEADGLRAIAATNTLRVPQPLAHGVMRDQGYLLLEWIDLQDNGDWQAAGERLAALHTHIAARYGAEVNNTIGATPQVNTWCDNWAQFWRACRLRPQFELAQRNGHHALAVMAAQAYAASDALLRQHQPTAALLHGDLWRGNFAFDARGQPVVFDPAGYYGDAQTDLAMTRLFGGFPANFFRAYEAARPPDPQRAARETLYQLYHVLNHANLFGGGYVMQAVDLIDSLR